MKKNLLSVLTFFAAAFGIGSLVALGDSIYNVAAGSYLMGGFWPAVNFYAQNAVADSALMVLTGAFFALTVGVYALIRPKSNLSPEKRWAAIFGPAFAFLLLITVAVPVNMYALPYAMTTPSLIVNGILLVVTLPLIAILMTYGSRLVKLFDRRGVFAVSLVFILVSAVSAALGLLIYKPGRNLPNAELIDGPNVIIITIDALRQDRVSAYGDWYVETPNLDAFASRSIRFEEACTNSPWTIPSMFAMNSSSYPSVHGADKFHKGNVNLVMLAEVLNNHGYDTEAYVANQILYGELGFNRGFDTYLEYGDIYALSGFKKASTYRFYKRISDKLMPYLGIREVDSTSWLTAEIVSSLNKDRRKPLFLWAHYLDPHTPLTPPREYMEGPEDFVDEALRFGFFETTDDDKLEEKDREKLVALYEAEVRYVDDVLEEVFKAIEENGLYDNSVIIVTADHGEEFFEHGKYGHARTHYDEVVSIPMFVYVPGIKPGVSEYPVSLIDLMPTILDLVGAGTPGNMGGETFAPVLEGSDDLGEGKFIFIDETAADRTKKSARDYPYTLIRTGSDKYDYDFRDNRIHRDPDDIVVDADEQVFDYYRTAVDDSAAAADAEAESLGGTTEIGIDAERREKLKGLGYLK